MSCCVCLLENPSTMEIFDDSGQQLKIAEVIDKHLWFKPQPDDSLSTKVCTICWLKIDDFHMFYQTVQKAHKEHNQNSLIGVKMEISCSSPIKLEQKYGEEVINDNAVSLIEPRMEISCSSSINPKQEYGEEVSNNNSVSAIEQRIKAEIDLQVKNSLEENSSEMSSIVQSDDEYEFSDDSDTSNSSLQEFSEENEFLSGADDTPEVEVSTKKNIGLKGKRNLEEDKDNIKKSEVGHGLDPTQTEEIIKKHIPMKCNLCIFVGTSFSDIEQHYQDSHPKVARPYILCCDNQFFKISEIAEHALRHEYPKSFRCEKCGKSYSRYYNLRKHELIHHASNQDLIYTCEWCPKKFIRSSMLRIHTKRMHEHEKSTCPVCMRQFRNKKSYEKHVRLHYQEKLKCDVCEKEFGNRKNLINHKYTVHTIKPFQCEKCDKTFRRNISLREHLARHNGEILNKCPFCATTFTSSATMNRHNRMYHPIQYKEWKNERATSRQKLN